MSTATVAKSCVIEPGLKIVTKSGRDYYKSTVYGQQFQNGQDAKLWAVDSMTKTEARKRHTARKAEAGRPRAAITDRTLGEVMPECFAYERAERVRGNRNTEYVDELERHWAKRVTAAGLATLKLSRFDQPTALRYLRYLRTLGLSESTQNGAVTAVRLVLRFARENGYMDPGFDPFLGIARKEFPDQKAGRKLTPLEDDQIVALVRAALSDDFRQQADTDYANIVIVNLFEGHRASETCGARWSAINLAPEARTFEIAGQAARDKSGRLVQTKNGKTRENKMHKLSAEALVRQRQLEWGKGLGQDDDPVFTMANGKPITRTHLLYAVRRAAKLAGLVGVTPQVLRHTFCTATAHAGIPAVEAAKMSGHGVAVYDANYVKPLRAQKQLDANAAALESHWANIEEAI